MMCMLFYQKFWEAVGTGWAVVLKKREEVRFLKKGEEASVSYHIVITGHSF